MAFVRLDGTHFGLVSACGAITGETTRRGVEVDRTLELTQAPCTNMAWRQRRSGRTYQSSQFEKTSNSRR
jgi:hypothetical protein